MTHWWSGQSLAVTETVEVRAYTVASSPACVLG